MRNDFSIEGLIKFALRPLLAMPFRLLSLIIPKDQKLWIFGCHGGNQFIGNTLYFYNYLQETQHSSKRIIITHNHETYNRLKSQGHAVLKAYSVTGLWAVARASKCFITNFVEDDINILTVSNRLRVYNLWHGMPIKSIRWPRPQWLRHALKIIKYQIPSPSLFLTTCTQELKATPELFNLTRAKLQPLGYPRNDIFFKPKPAFPLTQINSRAYQEIWLYAPTFRNTKVSSKPFTKSSLNKLDAYLRSKSILLLVSKHPVAKPIIIGDGFSNIIDVSMKLQDVQPLLCFVDLLITDYSSLCIDFALLEKPMVFYPQDYSKYAQAVGFTFDYFSTLPGPFARSETELISLLENKSQWSTDREYLEEIQVFRELFHQNRDGNASKRLLAYIEKAERI